MKLYLKEIIDNDVEFQAIVGELISNNTKMDDFNLSIASRNEPGKLIHI